MAYKKQSAFTIVELLVVIVVIGILAAITIVSYTGISQKATVASLTSDLTNASKQLKLFQVENSNYPTTIDCTIPDSTTNKCIKSSNGTTYQYIVNNSISPPGFCILATKSTTNYKIINDGISSAGDCTDFGLVLRLDAGNIASYTGSGTNWADLSGGNNNGTLVNGAGYIGTNGGALTFDGINDYASLTKTVNLNTKWSVIVPLRSFINEKNFQFFLGTSANTGNIGKILLSHSGYVAFSYPIGTYNHFSVLSSEINNIDSYLAIVSDGTSVYLYINGVLRSTITPAGTLFSVNLISNAWSDLAWESSSNIYGLDLYNRALSNTEISQKFNTARSRYGL